MSRRRPYDYVGADVLPGHAATALPPTPEGAHEGLVRLRTILDLACEGAMHAKTEGDLLIADDDMIRGLLQCRGAAHTLRDQILVRLAGIHGFKAKVQALQRRMRSLSVEEEIEVEDLPLLIEGLGDLPPESIIPQDILMRLRVPRGWRVTPYGVFCTAGRDAGERVAHAPIFTAGRLTEGREAAHRTLTWRGAWGWHEAIVPRTGIMTREGASRLLTRFEDCPAGGSTLGVLVDWLIAFDAANRALLPESRVSRSLGWQADKSFLLPDIVMASARGDSSASTQTSVCIPPPGADRILANVGAGGTWESWCAMYREVAGFPLMVTAVMASVGSPLIALLPRTAAPFALDISGLHGTGKTTALRLAASVWGRGGEGAQGILDTWESTQVAIEERTAFAGSIPIFLDDTKKSSAPDSIPAIVMRHTSGQGRLRGDKDGGLRQQSCWSNVLFSTGEGALVDFDKTGGTVDRCLCLRGSPLGGESRRGGEMARAVAAGTPDHYGHLGRRMAEWLCGLDEQGVADLERAHRRHIAEWTRTAHSATAQRLGTICALITLAHDIAEKMLGLPPATCDIAEYLHSVIEQAAPVGDRAAAALVAVEARIAANQSAFEGRITGPTRAVLGIWSPAHDWYEVCIVPATLWSWLREDGHADPQGIVDTWHQRGWLSEAREIDRPLRGRVGTPSHMRQRAPLARRKMAGTTVSLTAIRREAFEVAAGG